MIGKGEVFSGLPFYSAMLLCLSGCTGSSTYFITEKHQQRYEMEDLSAEIFNDDRSDWQHSTGASHISATRRDKGKIRDSNIIGKLYFDADGEGQGEKPHVITIRKAHRSYNAETALTEPIRIGKHDMTPHLSFAHHRDHDYVAGLTFRMPF